MKKLTIAIIVVFGAILIAAWIIAEEADPKMIEVNFEAPRASTNGSSGD